MNCYHCFHDTHKDLPLLKETYINTLYKLKGHNLDEISPTTAGEEFIYYNEIRNWLKTLTPNDVKKIKHQTNLTLLNREKILELKQISDETKVKYFFMPSIDGITKETYEATRIGGTFEVVMQNLKDLVDVFGPQNVKPSFTIKKTNVLDIQNIISFFRNNFGVEIDIGADVYDEFCRTVQPAAYEEYK